jgi:hypothetical protein
LGYQVDVSRTYETQFYYRKPVGCWCIFAKFDMVVLFKVQNKPLQLPKAEPENEYIGKNDMNQEKWIAKQMHNREIAKVQKNQIEERKRDELLRQIREQEEDAENILRDKHE